MTEINISQFWRQVDQDQGAGPGQVLVGGLLQVVEGCLLIVASMAEIRHERARFGSSHTKTGPLPRKLVWSLHQR